MIGRRQVQMILFFQVLLFGYSKDVQPMLVDGQIGVPPQLLLLFLFSVGSGAGRRPNRWGSGGGRRSKKRLLECC